MLATSSLMYQGANITF